MEASGYRCGTILKLAGCAVEVSDYRARSPETIILSSGQSAVRGNSWPLRGPQKVRIHTWRETLFFERERETEELKDNGCDARTTW